MKRIMIDIESLSLDPRALILSIGAVDFTDGQPQATFYANLNAYEQDGKRHISADTALWWIKQAMTNPAAAAALFEGTHIPLATALNQLRTFIGNDNDEREVWFNGPQFDAVALATAYNECGLRLPWKFRQERDCRTIFKLAEAHGWDSDSVDHTKFTSRNALSDAQIQVQRLLVALRFLGIA